MDRRAEIPQQENIISASHPGLSVWTRPQRRPRPALNRELIVSEAITLLDAEGMAALSMRTLGARLNAGATSIYRHVATRDQLIELAVDAVYGEIAIPELATAGQWRDAVTTCAESMREVILRHPWIAEALPGVGLAYLGPNVLRLNEFLLRVFDAAEFPRNETDTAISTVMGYVVGICLSEAAWLTTVARSGADEQQLVDQLLPTLERITSAHRRIGESIVARAESGIGAVRETKFRYGLERILDGLATRLPGWAG
ncbi:TetR/AcrR family transcriptional regulator [Nocardia sp. NPDC058058]|uniref:TetR/AcrR family transcriptional regulator n=1 Tax=Nocardia sp. NPDC058058 TaxID=3346317 RepID=UPI0036D84DC9